MMAVAQGWSVCLDSAAAPPYMDLMLRVGLDLTILAIIRLSFLTRGSSLFHTAVVISAKNRPDQAQSVSG